MVQNLISWITFCYMWFLDLIIGKQSVVLSTLLLYFLSFFWFIGILFLVLVYIPVSIIFIVFCFGFIYLLKLGILKVKNLYLVLTVFILMNIPLLLVSNFFFYSIAIVLWLFFLTLMMEGRYPTCFSSYYFIGVFIFLLRVFLTLAYNLYDFEDYIFCMKSIIDQLKFSFRNPHRNWGGNVDFSHTSYLLSIEEQSKLQLIGCSIVDSHYMYSTASNERFKMLPHYNIIKLTEGMPSMSLNQHFFNLTHPIFFSKVPLTLHPPHYGCYLEFLLFGNLMNSSNFYDNSGWINDSVSLKVITMPSTVVKLGTIFPDLEKSLCLNSQGEIWPVSVSGDRIIFGRSNFHTPEGKLALLFRDKITLAPHTGVVASMNNEFWSNTKLYIRKNEGGSFSLVGEITRRNLEKSIMFSDVKYRGLASQVLLRPAFTSNWVS